MNMKPHRSCRKLIKQGAEARLFVSEFFGRPSFIKERFAKKYRYEVLNKKLTFQRLKSEVRAIMRCRMNGIRTPTLYFVDQETNTIHMEYLKDAITLRDHIMKAQFEHNDKFVAVLKPLALEIGKTIAKIHENNVIHGDLTTSNMLLDSGELVIIDFGLSYSECLAEDRSVDLYVLERAFLSTHPNTESLFQIVLDGYASTKKNPAEIIGKLDEIRLRGRKRTMIG